MQWGYRTKETLRKCPYWSAPRTGRSCQRLAESDLGKGRRWEGEAPAPREPPVDVAEEPLGLGGGSWGRPGADGAGFSETLLRERQFCEGAELFAGGQRKRYLRPPPGEWAGNPLSRGQPVQRAGSPQRLQAGGSGV